MSFRERLANFINPKLNTSTPTNYPKSANNSGKRLWKDSIHPHMPQAIYNELTEFHDLRARDYQSKQNPALWMLSYGFANKLLQGQPYPFMYAEVDLDQNGGTETESNTENNSQDEAIDIQGVLEGDNNKLNAFPPTTPQGNPNMDSQAMEKPSMGLFGKQANEPKKPNYKLRRDLTTKYHERWLERDAHGVNMFSHFRRLIPKGLAIQSSVICGNVNGEKPLYWTFGADRIKKLKGERRVIREVEVEFYEWSIFEDTAKGQEKQGTQTYTLNKDCVLFTPLPCAEDPLGTSFIASMWDMGVYQQQNRFIHSLYLWNGGEKNRIYRYPNTMVEKYDKLIEQSAKFPWGSPSIQLDYPVNTKSEFIDKFFQFESTTAPEPAWDIANELNNMDTPFPKSFIEGQAETGALGGSAPEVDKQKEEEEMLRWFHILDSVVKQINITFFGATEEEFEGIVIVPWMDSLLGSDSNTKAESPTSESQQPKEEKQLQQVAINPEKKSSKSYSAKRNSVTETATIYQGNLFKEGWLPQDDGSKDWLSGEEIRKFVTDPKSVKTGYVYQKLKHPEKAEEVLKSQAWGKYEIIGYDPIQKQDITIFHIFDTDAPEEIYTSPMYYSQDQRIQDGNEEYVSETNLDVRNAIFTESPRSMGRTKATKIK